MRSGPIVDENALSRRAVDMAYISLSTCKRCYLGFIGQKIEPSGQGKVLLARNELILGIRLCQTANQGGCSGAARQDRKPIMITGDAGIPVEISVIASDQYGHSPKEGTKVMVISPESGLVENNGVCELADGRCGVN